MVDGHRTIVYIGRDFVIKSGLKTIRPLELTH